MYIYKYIYIYTYIYFIIYFFFALLVKYLFHLYYFQSRDITSLNVIQRARTTYDTISFFAIVTFNDKTYNDIQILRYSRLICKNEK